MANPFGMCKRCKKEKRVNEGYCSKCKYIKHTQRLRRSPVKELSGKSNSPTRFD